MKFSTGVSLYSIPNAAAGLMAFASGWLRSRPWLQLWSATLPLAVSLLLLWSLFANRLSDHRQSLIDDYRSAAQTAADARDTAGYRLNFRRVLELSGGRLPLRFEFASTLYDLGETDEALRMMSGLAPVKDGGYEPAHRFLADHIPADQSPRTDLLRAIHLGHIIARNSDARPERLQLVHLLSRHRSYERAEKLLRPTLNRFPEDSLTIARLKVRTAGIDAARSEAQHACQILQTIVTKEPDNIQRRIQLAQGYVFLARSGQALDVLCEAVPETPEALVDTALVDAMSRTYGIWLSLLPEQQRAIQRTCLSQLSMIPEPTEISDTRKPDDSKLSTLKVPGAPEPADAVFFAAILRSPHRGVVIPFLRGTIAGADGNLPVAEERLRIALSHAPDNPSISNNLAWVMLQDLKNVRGKVQRTARCDEALQLSKQAVDAAPGVPEFAGTYAALLAASQEIERESPE